MAEYEIMVPSYMIEGPHLVHLNGTLMNPGEDNDYTIGISNKNPTAAIIYWWDPNIKHMKKNISISITRMDTGERWCFSNVDGVFLDTRGNNLNDQIA